LQRQDRACLLPAGYLSEMQGVHGPFLVVVPLSTVPNWIREFRKWLPQLNSVVYVGDTKSREVTMLTMLTTK
jgi:chromodomain-helicase-DNA-binding protein 1